MTNRERAEDLVRRFDEPVRDITDYRVQAMINMTEEAINAAVEEKDARIAKLEAKNGELCETILNLMDVKTCNTSDGGTK